MIQEESIIYAAKLLENILSFFGVNVAVYSSYEDDVIQLAVPSTSLNSLFIGKDAANLKSLQYIISMALQNNGAELTRVNVDVADYKRQRADKVEARAEEWIKKVRETGEKYVANLNPADRRVVHKLAQDYSDIETHSEGEGRERVLIIEKKS